MLRPVDGRWVTVKEGTALVGSTRGGEILALERDEANGLIWFSQWDGQKFNRASAVVPLSRRLFRFYKFRQAPDGSVWCVGVGTILRWNKGMDSWQPFPALPAPVLGDDQNRIWFSGESGKVLWQKAGVFHQQEGLSRLLAVDRDGALIGYRADSDKPVIISHSGVSAPMETGLAKILGQCRALDGRIRLVGETLDKIIAVAHREDDGRWTTRSLNVRPGRIFYRTAPDETEGCRVTLLGDKTAGYEVIHVTSHKIESVDLGASPPPIVYPDYKRSENTERMSGASGLYRRDAQSQGAWTKLDIFGGKYSFTTLKVQHDEVLALFEGGPGKLPEAVLYRQEQWLYQEGEFDAAIYKDSGPTLYLTTRGGVYIRREPGTLDLSFLPLPENVYTQSLVEGEQGELWIGTSEGVLRYRPSTTLPGVEASCALMENTQGGLLPVTFRGLQQFSPDTPATAFRYSWRIDSGTWSPYENSPSQQLATASLSPGPTGSKCGRRTRLASSRPRLPP